MFCPSLPFPPLATFTASSTLQALASGVESDAWEVALADSDPRKAAVGLTVAAKMVDWIDDRRRQVHILPLSSCYARCAVCRANTADAAGGACGGVWSRGRTGHAAAV